MPPLNHNAKPLDLDEVRHRLASSRGKTYWRGLEELAESEAFVELLQREFPRQASEMTADPISRRRFLTLMAASLGLAGLAGCASRPVEKILPYVKQPEGLVPGRPQYYATAMTLAGYATGLVVTSREGRPVKIEGNPDHPASLGATDVFAQASLLSLYDPDRERPVSRLGRVAAWDEALTSIGDRLRAAKGEGVRVLTPAVSSPTVTRLLTQLLKDVPGARWHVHEPTRMNAVGEGIKAVFQGDASLEPVYEVGKAAVILALDSDFLDCGPGSVPYSRAWAKRRAGEAGQRNRLYSVEGVLSMTGSVADHRLPVRPSQVEAVARAVAVALGVAGVRSGLPLRDDQARWAEAVARDLKARPKGTTVVIPGDSQPAPAHAIAHAINSALGNVGETVRFIEPVLSRPPGERTSLADLAEDMDRGEVKTLLILGGNPAYDSPADLRFAERLNEVELRVHLGLHHDETSRLCHWHLPESHYLEAWGDCRAFDGTATVQQPLIAPLYNGKSVVEVLLGLTRGPSDTGRDAVRETWRAEHEKSSGVGDFEGFWKGLLHSGVVPGTAREPVKVTPRADLADALAALPAGGESRGMELIFRPDPAVFDGSFANNGWLQELPKPITRLTWDNAALVSPNTARELGVGYSFGSRGGEHGEAYADVVKLECGGRELTLPVWIVPGHADGTVTVHLGHGRTHAGKVGNGVGFNAYALRTSRAPWFDSGLSLTKAGGRHLLACVQGHHGMEGRGLVRTAPLQHENHEGHGESKGRRPLTMADAHDYPPDRTHKWAMAIDLAACTGCGACVVACHAENNIPVVGKAEVTRGREMHWLRVDRYFEGDPFEHPDKLRTFHQPVPCMHCDNAPCEVVCPVAATVHSQDGLNDMVYNRCVGTRYCSNNCPYKVRRFNFFEYQDWTTPSLRLARNPEVTVRSRGVMEKCTYCVQRIRKAEIEGQKRGLRAAEAEGRQVAWDDLRVRDGEVMTACQQVCPTGAIVFGDFNDAGSRVRRLKADERNYGLLEHLNTRPATTYLAAVRNPNPELG